jgi:hypothetical protein
VTWPAASAVAWTEPHDPAVTVMIATRNRCPELPVERKVRILAAAK